MKKYRENANKVLLVTAALAFAAAFIFFGILTITPEVSGDGNKSVKTYVNITNTEPQVADIVISPYPTITLNPGNITTVACNATVWDWNGYNDVLVKNATLFYSQGGYNTFSGDMNGSHYTNLSCGACTQYDASPTNASCICSFAVLYYATNGTWTCNVSVSDKGGFLPTETPQNFTSATARTVNISALIALDAPGAINYGNLTVTQTSTAKLINITNLGNRLINISILAYGGDNMTTGDNLSMRCPQGNISVDRERFSFDSNPTFGSMNIINTSFKVDTNITVARITNETINHVNASNSTYWKLQIPLSVGGYCNGTIVFAASDSLLP